MASGGKSKIERLAQDFLSCSLCLDTFTDPCSLDCLHTFCRTCLVEYVTSQGAPPVQKLQCPVCRQTATLPDAGVDGLKTNYFVRSLQDFVEHNADVETCGLCDGNALGVIRCVECACMLCLQCKDAHANMKMFKSHSLSKPDSDHIMESEKGEQTCIQHKKPLKLFCSALNCSVPICVECQEEHEGHKIDNITIREKECRDTLNSVIAHLTYTKTIKQKVLSAFEEKRDDLKTDRDCVKKSMEAQIQEILLQTRKEGDDFIEETLSIVDKEADENRKKLKDTSDFVTSTDHLIQFIEQLVVRSSPVEVVTLAPVTLERYREVLEPANTIKEPKKWHATEIQRGEIETTEIRKMIGSVQFQPGKQEKTEIRKMAGSEQLCSRKNKEDHKDGSQQLMEMAATSTIIHDDVHKNLTSNNGIVAMVEDDESGVVAILDAANRRLKVFSRTGKRKWASAVDSLPEDPQAVSFYSYDDECSYVVMCATDAKLVQDWGVVSNINEGICTHLSSSETIDFAICNDVYVKLKDVRSNQPRSMSVFALQENRPGELEIDSRLATWRVSCHASFITLRNDDDLEILVSGPDAKYVWKFDESGNLLWDYLCRRADGTEVIPGRAYFDHRGQVFVWFKEQADSPGYTGMLMLDPKGKFLKELNVQSSCGAAAFCAPDTIVVGVGGCTADLKVYRY